MSVRIFVELDDVWRRAIGNVAPFAIPVDKGKALVHESECREQPVVKRLAEPQGPYAHVDVIEAVELRHPRTIRRRTLESRGLIEYTDVTQGPTKALFCGMPRTVRPVTDGHPCPQEAIHVALLSLLLSLLLHFHGVPQQEGSLPGVSGGMHVRLPSSTASRMNPQPNEGSLTNLSGG